MPLWGYTGFLLKPGFSPVAAAVRVAVSHRTGASVCGVLAGAVAGLGRSPQVSEWRGPFLN